MADAFICDAVRTPIGRYAGALSSVRTDDLAALPGHWRERRPRRYNSRMNPSAPTTWQYLAPNPRSCYKQLFVKGTRIRARVLYGLYVSADEPMSREEIAADFGLPVEAVDEAIAYCQADPPEVAGDFEREERLIAASAAGRVVPPDEVARILRS